MARFSKKRDSNEPEIVIALQAMGAVVSRIEGFTDWGVPDLLVGYRGRTILLEVKNPDGGHAKSKRTRKGDTGPSENAKGQLTPTQVTWWSAWIGGEVYLVETPEQAVAIVRGVELPAHSVNIEADGQGVSIEIGNAPLSPQEADTLAGAIHEYAGVARAIQRTENDNA